jgi:hypothetical protein
VEVGIETGLFEDAEHLLLEALSRHLRMEMVGGCLKHRCRIDAAVMEPVKDVGDRV